ncbi:hypothetical protein [Burkholderia ubonensis]|uniref:hypothetical protein n=1 Tax=Burkholderia ubonensis TaxID=101571 RepID=UPI0007542625|nr:hypothetical protein [Burkholderia ubonensis]KWI10903.1 hypothetical protein WM01_19290 [Burkholderia ubonensis]OJA94462.1 hypothetical protein BGV51_28300 [Burkholderia ubonensis]
MKLRKITNNAHELSLPGGVRVLFSYGDAVAAYHPDTGWIKTSADMTKATAWAVKEWLHELDAENVRPVDQAVLDTLLVK